MALFTQAIPPYVILGLMMPVRTHHVRNVLGPHTPLHGIHIHFRKKKIDGISAIGTKNFNLIAWKKKKYHDLIFSVLIREILQICLEETFLVN